MMAKRFPVVVVQGEVVWIGAPGWWCRLTAAEARELANALLAQADAAEKVEAAEAS